MDGNYSIRKSTIILENDLKKKCHVVWKSRCQIFMEYLKL